MSARANIQEDSLQNKQWDTVSVPITLQHNNWGISENLNESIIAMLESLGLYKDVSGNRVFTIDVLKILVKYMYQQKIDTTKLADAVEILMSDYQRQLTMETQRVLNKFVSIEAGSSNLIIVDGVWKEDAAMLLEKIVNDYQLSEHHVSPKLLRQLKTISGRLVRADLREKLQPPLIGGNSFFIIDPLEKKLVLLFNRGDDSDLFLTNDVDHIQLAKINWRRSWQRDKNSFSSSFEKFSRWIMLLMMKGKGMHYDYVDIQLGKDGNPPATIEDFYDPANGLDFMMKVDYVLQFQDQHPSVPLEFFPKAGNDINVFAVLFSEDLNISITQGYRTGASPANGTSALIDFEYFFRKAEPDEPVQCLQNANFLKLFVVRNSFGKSGNDFTLSPSDITTILSADEGDILSTVTIGLKFSSNDYTQTSNEMP